MQGTEDIADVSGERARAAGAESPGLDAARLDSRVRSALALFGYVALKSIFSSKEEAHAFVDRLNLDNLGPKVAADAAVPVERTAILDLFRTGAEQLEADDFEAAFANLRSAGQALVSLIEQGEAEDGKAVISTVVDAVATDGRWNILSLLSALASVVVAGETGERTPYGYSSRIALFCGTDGHFNHAINAMLRLARPPQPHSDRVGLLGLEDEAVLAGAVERLNVDGYNVFERRLPEDMVERLTAFARTAPGRPQYHSGLSETSLRLDEVSEPMDGFWCDPGPILDQPDVQRLLTDPSFLGLAREYLGCEPALGSVAMWWSFPFPESPGRESNMAQQFHFDGDWSHFLNFFFYLTDVDADGGPHAYVRGSHRRGNRPRELLSRGYARITDEEMRRFYPEEDLVTLTAPRGTVIAGNTRCWHRGSRPTHRPRLMMEFVFVDTALLGRAQNGLFAPRPDYLEAYRAFVQAHPDVFRYQRPR